MHAFAEDEPNLCHQPNNHQIYGEWDVHTRCIQTLKNILHHSGPKDWMMALVDLTYMVSSLVDYGIHRVMVFEGRVETRIQFMSSMESRGARNIASKRRTKGNANDLIGSGSTRAQISSNSEDKSPSHVEEDDVASEEQRGNAQQCHDANGSVGPASNITIHEAS